MAVDFRKTLVAMHHVSLPKEAACHNSRIMSITLYKPFRSDCVARAFASLTQPQGKMPLVRMLIGHPQWTQHEQIPAGAIGHDR